MTDEQTAWRDVSRSSKRSFHHLRDRSHMNARPFGQTCCTTTPAAMAFWGLTFVLVYGLARVAGSFWPAVGHYGDTLILTSSASRASRTSRETGPFIAAYPAPSSCWVRWWQPRWRRTSRTWICVSSGAFCSRRLPAHC
jgi:hypothetical protein